MDKDTPQTPQEITEREAFSIALVGQPQGLFYYWDDYDYSFVGIDNSDGMMRTEKFRYLKLCIKWLEGCYVAGICFYKATRLYSAIDGGSGGYIGYEVNPKNDSLTESCRFKHWSDCSRWIAEQNLAQANFFQY